MQQREEKVRELLIKKIAICNQIIDTQEDITGNSLFYTNKNVRSFRPTIGDIDLLSTENLIRSVNIFFNRIEWYILYLEENANFDSFIYDSSVYEEYIDIALKLTSLEYEIIQASANLSLQELMTDEGLDMLERDVEELEGSAEFLEGIGRDFERLYEEEISEREASIWEREEKDILHWLNTRNFSIY